MALYETLAQHYIDDIQAQRLPAGSRLPALRTMAKQHQISMTTATKAYDYLQQTGWIYAQPQSGYFVANQLEATTFPSLDIKSIEQRDPKRFAPLNGYNPASALFSPLGTSMIAPELQPSIALQRSIKRVTQRAEKHLFQYPETQGDKGLRSALAEHFRHHNLAFSAADFVITNGCIDAVRLAIESVTKEGDTIAISSPCFSGLLDLLSALSRKVIEIPVSDKGLDLDHLETLMQQGLIKASLFSTSNMNPTGMTLPVEQKQALARLAAQYNTPMIEDDVYFELSHQKQHTLPAKYWDKEGYVIWCGSFSKTLAAGLRLGWCVPGRYLTPYIKQHALTSFGVNGLIQSCMAEFINTGEYRSHVNKIRTVLNQHIHLYQQCLIEHLPEQAKISTPQGGIVLWVQIPSLNAVQLEKEANKQGIDIRSGACFSTHDFYHDCFRLNCGWPLDNTEDKHSTYQQLISLCDIINRLIKAKT
ncbi:MULTISPECIES: PLP-dependent aminotransferase family protein [Marinomonas]|uniref:PLP-dependent aminotransferase family protein n=1 Tax=Marinomonas arctica TaxID=383750 RepID=A0A7H1J884_9GAMM|nr:MULTISPECIES: PLP-dependent aminotransferase family protein [Marinomonas]MCS7486656.1 aminotransferase [Marinomonas sp. BSi20414]QNT06700.1 PLP-dependent aminotransferase family protein [Marinomonas arctica]GGN22852.1 GntR family transcriptional regulator [Marinomonas arctica]